MKEFVKLKDLKIDNEDFYYCETEDKIFHKPSKMVIESLDNDYCVRLSKRKDAYILGRFSEMNNAIVCVNESLQNYKRQAMSLYKPPFRYDSLGGYIWDSENNMFADQGECEVGTIARIRGAGRLSYFKDGEKIQDAMGEILAESLNLYFEKFNNDI